MLEWLKAQSDGLSGMPKERQAAVAAHFQDPVAQKVSWAPLHSQAGTFAHVALQQQSAQRLELRASSAGKRTFKIFVPILAVVGLLLTLQALKGAGVVYIAASALCWLGLWTVLAQLRKRTVFDKAVGYFWEGAGAGPRDAKTAAQTKGAIPLADLYAVQVIPKRVLMDRHDDDDDTPLSLTDTYAGFELNLVRRDGGRVALMNHTEGGTLRRDAATIAAFLNVPVWDAGDVP